MATNKYFESSFTAKLEDQKLVEDLIIESIQIFGRDYHYLPRTLTNFDAFFGEDAQSAFNQIGTVEMYLENVHGWEGEGEFISKFGLEIRDEATLVVAIKRFKETIGSEFDLPWPREGDIVVFPQEVDKRKRAFEISWVDEEPIFYQLGKLDTYRLKVRTFEFNGETFDTGDENIDSYNRYSHSQKIQLKAGGIGFYSPGEVVSQGKEFAATVIKHDIDENILVLSSNVSPEAEAYNPSALKPIVGLESAAEWFLDEVKDDVENVPIADNDTLSEELKDILSTKESNPFSGL